MQHYTTDRNCSSGLRIIWVLLISALASSEACANALSIESVKNETAISARRHDASHMMTQILFNDHASSRQDNAAWGEVAIAKRSILSIPKRLRLQVVDPEGNPVVGATVSGRQTGRLKLRTLSSKEYPFREVTDSEGRFSKALTKKRVSFTVYAEGYYEVSARYDRGEVPRKTIVIVLEREHEKVPVYTSTRFKLSHVWNDDADFHELGLQFRSRSRKGGDSQWTPVKGEAHIWVTMQKLPDPPPDYPDNRIVWRITLEGLNGWELQQGVVGQYLSSLHMRAAPLDGYEKSFTYLHSWQTDMNFYLRLDGGKRYGKLYDFEFRSRGANGSWGPNRSLRTQYLVQAEDTNSPSLNPGPEMNTP